jgi:hypothetical protein
VSYPTIVRETLDKLIKNVPTAGLACNALLPSKDAPPPLDRKEYPQVCFWTAKSFEAYSNNLTGETDGLATHQKRPGRRSKSEINEGRHPYLENKDGSAVPQEIIDKVGHKARRLWHALKDVSMAPSSWGKASEVAYKYFNDGMLTEPEFVFFRYCEGNWKLMRWATRAYSSWAHNHMKSNAGNNKTSQATKRKRASLDDPSLIRLDDDQDMDIPTAVSPPPDAAPVDDTPSSLEPSTSDSVPSQVLYVHIRHRDIFTDDC